MINLQEKNLRGGFTTGAAAAAGALASLYFLRGEKKDRIDFLALDKTPLSIPIKNVESTAFGAKAEVIKDAGDDPDITNGVSIFTEIHILKDTDKIIFKAGVGIGIVTKKGLALEVGEPAINPGPRKLIANLIKPLLNENMGAEIIISIPVGKELAKKTLNPTLGIEGGLSVIGTTGVLRPMSEEGFKNALLPQIDIAKAAGFNTQVFVPGKIGERIAIENGIPKEAVVETSNFIGFMLDAAREKKLSQILLFGHLGKLSKVAAGVFYTHNRVADARMETIAAYAAEVGISSANVNKILTANTTEDALTILDEENLTDIVCKKIAKRASERATRYVFNELKIGTVLVTLKGRLLGTDKNAEEILREIKTK